MDRTTCNALVRVLIFPLAAQGHVNAMLKLAEMIALSGVHVTFLNTDHINDLLLRHTDVHSRLSRYPGFLFRTISDGLPPDYPRSGEGVMEVLYSMNETLKAIFKMKLISGEFSSEDGPSVSCIIADGILGGFTTDVANELRIPIIHFRTISACAYWAYFFALDLAHSGELPIRGEEDMERAIRGVPGMEHFLRCRDLPGFCRVSDVYNDRYLNMVVHQTHQSPRAQALILNTFDDLEGPIISHVRTKCPNVYSVGPLGPHLSARLAEAATASTSTTLTRSESNLFDMDRSCMTWLDAQPPNSVIYVSFGSIAVLTEDDMSEFLHGLVNSKNRFLWVGRENLLRSLPTIVRELSEAVAERGFVAGWVPQEEVLCHVAVGGFLTHSGWNSTLESVVAGVPMLCWPYFADQQTNSRFVGEFWKLGIDMKDVCDRNVVEKLVNDLMVERREEFQRSAIEMARLAKKSVVPGGSSYCSFDRMIQSIKLMGNLH